MQTESKMQTVVTWYMLKISVVCSLHFTLSLMFKVYSPQSAIMYLLMLNHCGGGRA